MDNLSDLIRDIKKIPTDKAYKIRKEVERSRSPIGEAIVHRKSEQLFFDTIEKGDPNDIPILENLIGIDPYQYLRDNNHPNSILNKKNLQGYTPLHLACKNGNLEIVKYFLHKGAD